MRSSAHFTLAAPDVLLYPHSAPCPGNCSAAMGRAVRLLQSELGIQTGVLLQGLHSFKALNTLHTTALTMCNTQLHQR